MSEKDHKAIELIEETVAGYSYTKGTPHRPIQFDIDSPTEWEKE